MNLKSIATIPAFFLRDPSLRPSSRRSFSRLTSLCRPQSLGLSSESGSRGAMAGPKAVVIAGPSGVGKGTLIGKLEKEFPSLFGFSVSHTTRPPRAGEVDGKHYNFTTVEQILADVGAGKFIEHAEVHGKHYGTSVAAVERVRAAGKICVLDIDVQGCRSARAKGLHAAYVFVAPPSLAALESRLRGRGTESEDAIATRLKNSKAEIDAKDEKGLFDAVIVNDDLDKAYAELKALLADDMAAAKKAQE